MKKKNAKKALASLAIAGMALSVAPLNAFADGVTTDRLSGSDRIGTAIQVAEKGFSTGATTAILAPAADANLVDALAAAPLAGKTAPILLTDNNTLSSATQAELVKLGVTQVYVVGAISQSVVDQVNAISGVTATPLKGSDRIGTAAAISAKLTQPAGSFVVGYGALADALSVASYAAANNYSILVANPDGSLPASEAAYKGDKVYIIGGPTLVKDIDGATRIFGSDRFATNQDVLSQLSFSYNNVYVANGADAHLVDSLVASSLAAQSGAPIVLGNTTSAAAASDVHAKLAANAVVTALGGTTVVPDAVVSTVVSGVPVTPPVGSNVTLSDLQVTGQTTGTGALTAPAILPVNGDVTVKTTMNGSTVAGLNIQYLVATTDNITATSNGQTLSSTELSTPVIIGNDQFKYSYSVPVDAQGNASVVFTSSASSDQPFNVVAQAPYSDANGNAVKSNESRIQWGLPGTLVLAPMYSNTPDNLNFSSSSNAKAGLVSAVATYLPANSTDTVSGKVVQFTLGDYSGDTNGSVYFTDQNGSAPTAGSATLVDGASNVNYTATTDSNGQAVVYVNSMVPTQNGVPLIGVNVGASVYAQIVNGGGSTGTSYFKWQSQSYPAQITNVSPAKALNDVASSNNFTANSGSQVTFSGTVVDASGNPVPNARLVVTDWDTTAGSSDNLDNDSFIPAGSTTPELFSSTNFDIVTTDANGGYSFTTTATIPSTQDVSDSSNYYYVSYAPATLAVVSGQSLPSGLIPLTVNASAHNAYGVLWQQGQTVQALGVSTSVLPGQYADVTSVPQSLNFTKVIGAARELFVAAYNQNGQLVAPGSNNQFAGYNLSYTITAPSGMSLTTLDGTATLNNATFASVSGSNFTKISSVKVTLSDNGTLSLDSVTGTYNNGTSDVSGTFTPATTGAVFTPTALPNVGSGVIELKVNTNSDVNTSSTIAGSLNVSVSVKHGDDSKGGASASISGTFTPTSAVATLGVAPSLDIMTGYGPLLNKNAPLSNQMSVSGSAYGSGSASSTNEAKFIVGAFNAYPNLSTVPSQGITYTVTSDKSGEIDGIDGYDMSATGPSSATVNIQGNGLVSVNNVALWNNSNVTGKVVAYGSAGGTNYILSQDTTAQKFHLYTLSSPVGPNAAATEVLTGWSYAAADLTSGSMPTSPNVAYKYVFSGTSLTIASSNSGSGSLATAVLPAVTSAVTLTPVQLATVSVGDEYTEAPTFTVSNSINSQTATVAGNFTSAQSGMANVVMTPMNVTSVQGQSQQVTFIAEDVFGNPLPNQVFYLGANVPGLWITQVNGQQITASVQLNGSTNSASTVAQAVPLFALTDGVSTTATLGSSSVSVNGLTAHGFANGAQPTVSLTTGSDGTVSITLQDGNVQYVGTADNTETTYDYQVADGVTIDAGTNLNVYSTAALATAGDPTTAKGALGLNWQ